MIHETTGDILMTRAQAIAHGVAPDDHFNQGLALALRERWPGMARDFRHHCFTSHPQPGEVWMWGGPGGIRIVNLMTQTGPDHHQGHPGRASLDLVNHALRNLRDLIVAEGLRSVALPRLATGVGGLEWEDVLPRIHRYLGELDIPVYVYSHYVPGEIGLESELDRKAAAVA